MTAHVVWRIGLDNLRRADSPCRFPAANSLAFMTNLVGPTAHLQRDENGCAPWVRLSRQAHLGSMGK